MDRWVAQHLHAGPASLRLGWIEYNLVVIGQSPGAVADERLADCSLALGNVSAAPVTLFALLAAAYWPGILSAAVAPRWCLLYLGTPLVLLLAPAASTLWQGIASWLWVWWLGLAAVSLLWSPDSLVGFNSLVHLLALFGAFTVGAAYGSRGAIYGAALGLVPSVLIAPWDAGGLFWNKNVFAEAAALVAVYFVVEKRYWLSAPFLFGILWANSRAAVVALAVAILPGLPRRWRWTTLLSSLLLFALLTAAQQWGAASLQTRAAMWVSTVAFLSPFGNGLGSFAHDYPIWEHPHNEVLFLAYELGALALVPLGLLGYVYSMEPRVHRYPDYHTGQDRAPKAVLLALAVLSLAAFPLTNPLSAAVGAACAGYLARTRSDVRVSQLVRRVGHKLGLRPSRLTGRGARGRGSGAGAVPL